MCTCLEQTSPLQELIQLCVQLGTASCGGLLPSDQDDIPTWLDELTERIDASAQPTLDPVAHYRAAHALAHREADSQTIATVVLIAQHKASRSKALARFANPRKVFRAGQPVSPG